MSAAPMQAAIAAVRYTASVKIGLQFKRRFWEEDEAIYGGITFTDLPITQLSYPSSGLHSGGKGVLLGGYAFGGACRGIHRAVAGASGCGARSSTAR